MHFYNLPLGRMEALPFHAVASSRASTLPARASLWCLFAVINFYLFIYVVEGLELHVSPLGVCSASRRSSSYLLIHTPHHAGHQRWWQADPWRTRETCTCVLAWQAWSAAGFGQWSCISQQLSSCTLDLYKSSGWQWGGPRHPDVSPGSITGPTWPSSGPSWPQQTQEGVVYPPHSSGLFIPCPAEPWHTGVQDSSYGETNSSELQLSIISACIGKISGVWRSKRLETAGAGTLRTWRHFVIAAKIL